MKTKAFLITLITVITITVLVFQSCKKDEETANQQPTCKITSPTNGQEIPKGETMPISVYANDSDGNITEVLFVIDGIEKGFTSDYPFKYNWSTISESVGSHILKATSVDNSGGHASDEITIELTGSGSNACEGQTNLIYGGQTYEIIEIGIQCWMAENLNYQTSNSWCYNNIPANGDIYGRLYTQDAALTACPGGWHLPSDDEWKTLEMYHGMSQDEAENAGWRGENEGGKMKETGTSHWNSPNTGATNSNGFTARPGGNHYSNGSFNVLGKNGTWWTSTELWARLLDYEHGQVYSGTYPKSRGFSVRCVKD